MIRGDVLIAANLVSAKMADRNELAQLEAERDRLLSMIAYHDGPFYRVFAMPRTPTWLGVAAVAIICAIGLAMIAGAFAGQISASDFLFLVVGLPLLAYILWRLVRHVERPAGEPEIHQRLADCEARIMKLKEGRP
jgi:preprotein translocase subunit Sss1